MLIMPENYIIFMEPQNTTEINSENAPSSPEANNLTEGSTLISQRSKEEIEELMASAEKLKVEANSEYKSKNYLEAMNLYSLGITSIITKYSDEMPPHYISTIADSVEKEFHSLLSTLFMNRGLCFKQLKEVDPALDMFSKSILFNQDNSKAIYQRLELNYQKGEYMEAQDDYNKLKSTNSKLLSEFKVSEYILNLKAEQKKKEMTDDMLGKLKDVGNSVLGLFGMNLNNFQMNQQPGGGYNIQYKN